ncbi:hypothetical protein [Rhodococcoides yunnanense]|jgi:hypothetical protein|uniref:hypothetical protein n=1 Tax=Rhodococcoides yunnanense TaxID=278209 RepID=UPI0022B1F3D0|nr:hypothetical protein [Rhodococcus yunnanensis]MCZ4277400.1 hypothetical protein [Rhodococcus yunnanensis]
MNTSALTSVRRATLAAAALAALAVVAGCGTSTDSGPSTTAPAPAPACSAGIDQFTRADLCDPEAVMTAALSAMYSYHPATQTQKGVDIGSAATLLDPGYLDRLGVSYSALAPVTGNTWEQWKADEATVAATAVVASDDHPADTDTTVARVVAVHQSVHDNDGTETEQLPPLAIYTTATRTASGGWAVSGVNVR